MEGDVEAEGAESDDSMDKETWSGDTGRAPGVASDQGFLTGPASFIAKGKNRALASPKLEDENYGFFGVRCQYVFTFFYTDYSLISY